MKVSSCLMFHMDQVFLMSRLPLRTEFFSRSAFRWRRLHLLCSSFSVLTSSCSSVSVSPPPRWEEHLPLMRLISWGSFTSSGGCLLLFISFRSCSYNLTNLYMSYIFQRCSSISLLIWSMMRLQTDTCEAARWSPVLFFIISVPVGRTNWPQHEFYWKANSGAVINVSSTCFDGPAGGSFGRGAAYKVQSHLSPAELRVNAGATNTRPWHLQAALRHKSSCGESYN